MRAFGKWRFLCCTQCYLLLNDDRHLEGNPERKASDDYIHRQPCQPLSSPPFPRALARGDSDGTRLPAPASCAQLWRLRAVPSFQRHPGSLGCRLPLSSAASSCSSPLRVMAGESGHTTGELACACAGDKGLAGNNRSLCGRLSCYPGRQFVSRIGHGCSATQLVCRHISAPICRCHSTKSLPNEGCQSFRLGGTIVIRQSDVLHTGSVIWLDPEPPADASGQHFLPFEGHLG